MEAKKTPPPKRKTPAQDSTSIEMEELQYFEIVELSNESSGHKFLHRPKVQGQQRRIKKM
jgi:hypothetical protein